jgi:hypothetical protein
MVPPFMVPSGRATRVLCADHAADAEGGDEHDNDDQFLYHLVNSSEDQFASGD